MLARSKKGEAYDDDDCVRSFLPFFAIVSAHSPPPPLLTSSQALLAARRRPGGRSIAPLAPGGAAARSSAARAPPAPSGAAAAADRTAQRRAPTRSWRRGGRVCSAPCVSRPEVTGGVDAQLGAREDGRACVLCVLAPDGMSSGAGDCSPRPLGTLSPLNTTINHNDEAKEKSALRFSASFSSGKEVEDPWPLPLL